MINQPILLRQLKIHGPVTMQPPTVVSLVVGSCAGHMGGSTLEKTPHHYQRQLFQFPCERTSGSTLGTTLHDNLLLAAWPTHTCIHIGGVPEAYMGACGTSRMPYHTFLVEALLMGHELLRNP